MVLDVLMMTSVVEKRSANLEVVKLNQVGTYRLRLEHCKIMGRLTHFLVP